MVYLYILHSTTADKYFVGHSENPWDSLAQHNSSTDNKYTGKFSDWKLMAVFEAGNTKAEALELEKFINRQKNIKLVLKLIDPTFIPADKLAQLVRVPHIRD
jgi:putative endonuclease